MGVIAAALHKEKLLRENKMAALHHPWGVIFLPLLLLVALYLLGTGQLLLALLHQNTAMLGNMDGCGGSSQNESSSGIDSW